MRNTRETASDGGPGPSTKERRRWERYPSAHDSVTVTDGAVEQRAVVLNVSALGMGLAIAPSHGFTEGQLVTIDGPSGPVSAVICHATTDDQGTFRIGVEWCE
jgi:hypothetical protein